jgi:3-oxoacyl-[acyl-carrier protein] reductase
VTDLPLGSRVALVTGVSRRAGIGFAVAQRLLEMGASVFAQGWTPHDAAMPWGADPGGAGAVLDELRGFGPVEYLEADFVDPEAPRRVVEAAAEAFGHVDVLVANHARSGHGRLAETNAGELDAFLHENVRATILLVQAFAARHDGRPGGRVVLLTSGQHLGPMPGELAYAVSKGAIQQATATLADELAERSITVNTVNPGPTDTGYATPEQRAEVLARMPRGALGRAGRHGTPDRLAVHRRGRLGDRPGDQLGGRLPPLRVSGGRGGRCARSRPTPNRIRRECTRRCRSCHCRTGATRTRRRW